MQPGTSRKISWRQDWQNDMYENRKPLSKRERDQIQILFYIKLYEMLIKENEFELSQRQIAKIKMIAHKL
jgi:hypothetical protein